MSNSPTCHVLVADDEPHIGRIIKMKLEQGPFRVTLAYDGREALEVLEREPRHPPRAARPDDAAPERSRRARRDARATRGGESAVHHPHGGRPGAAAHERHGSWARTTFSPSRSAPRSSTRAPRSWSGSAPTTRASTRRHEPLGRRARRRHRLAILAAVSTPVASKTTAATRHLSEPLLADAVDAACVRSSPSDRTLILTNDVIVPAIAELLPDIPRANLVAEPRAGGHGGGADVGGAGDRAPRRTRRRHDLGARRLGGRRPRGFPAGARARRGGRRSSTTRS